MEGSVEDENVDYIVGTFQGDDEASEKKPLQNPVILRHLFQLCPAAIIASCRLVCKQWHEESLLSWRTNFPIAISMSYTGEIFLDKGWFTGRAARRNGRRIPLQEVLEFASQPKNQATPYRNFKIHSCTSVFWIENHSPFWSSIGANLTTLTLFNCTFQSVRDFRNVVYKYCPILQHLRIIICRFPSRHANDDFEYKEPLYGERPHLKSLHLELSPPEVKTSQFLVSWIELFSHFHSLGSLGLECCDKFSESEILSMVEALLAAIQIVRKQDSRKLPLRSIALPSKFTVSRELASMMKELRLPLRQCYIEVVEESGEEGEEFWRSQLEINASSMQSITVINRVHQLEFGMMLPNVTRMNLRAYVFENFNFLKYMPNLMELEISHGHAFYPVLTNAVSNTTTGQQQLEMRRLMRFSLGFYASDQELVQLSRWMPNINHLEVALTDVEQFATVISAWKCLRILKAKFMDNLPVGGEEWIKNEAVAKLELLESLILPYGKLTPGTLFHLFQVLPVLQFVEDAQGGVVRDQLNLSSYQQAVQDNATEQWIAAHGIRELGRESI